MPDYRAAARRAAIRAGLDPDVFERQINQESGFNPGARSGAGAIGIAQIMPATARGWHVDPTDPIAALNAAARHMKGYVDQFGSYRNALIAYNAGPGAVGRALPAETQNYIKVILNGKTPPAPRGVSPQAAKASASSPISAAQNAETSFAPLTMPERPKVQATGPAAPSFTAKAVQASTPGPSSVVGNRLTAAGALTALETLQAQTPGTVDNSDKPTGAGASKTSSADAVTGGTRAVLAGPARDQRQERPARPAGLRLRAHRPCARRRRARTPSSRSARSRSGWACTSARTRTSAA
jgi:hypothetical protein